MKKRSRKKGEEGDREEGEEPGFAAWGPSYLDELLKLPDVGLQLGLLDAQLLPAEVQGFHSALECLGVGAQRGQEGPRTSCPRASAPRPPTFHPMPGSVRAGRPRTLLPPRLRSFLSPRRERRSFVQDFWLQPLPPTKWGVPVLRL